jgi:hypothetical protein
LFCTFGLNLYIIFMLQRIQSVYLTGAFICSALVFFTYFCSLQAGGLTYILSTKGFTLLQTEGNKILERYIALPIISGISAALTIFILFRFRNRIQQIKLAQLSLLMNTLLIASVFYYAEEAINFLKVDVQVTDELKPGYSIATILPIISIIFTLMAIRSIKKDEALVRAADRIR